MPLLGHRQALLRAIGQLPMLTQAADPREDSPQPGRTANPPHSAPRCAVTCVEAGGQGEGLVHRDGHVKSPAALHGCVCVDPKAQQGLNLHAVCAGMLTQDAAAPQPVRPHPFGQGLQAPPATLNPAP